MGKELVKLLRCSGDSGKCGKMLRGHNQSGMCLYCWREERKGELKKRGRKVVVLEEKICPVCRKGFRSKYGRQISCGRRCGDVMRTKAWKRIGEGK